MALPVLMDVDTGVDDAIAILLALASEEINLLGVTTVAGNVPLANTTKNTLAVLSLAGREDVPVAVGASKPLFNPLKTAPAVHGEDGLGGAQLPVPRMQPVSESAVQMMRRILLTHPEPVTLVPVGPLTNIALLLRAYPEVKENIAQIVLMGGGAYRGNATVASEFNIYVDAEAAHIVFASGIPIVMAGLDVTMKAYITPEEIAQFAAAGTKTGDFCARAFRFYAKAYGRYEELNGAIAVHDAVAVTYLLHPEWFESRMAYVEVDIDGALSYACTTADLRKEVPEEAKNTRVLFGIDRERFQALLLERVCGTREEA